MEGQEKAVAGGYVEIAFTLPRQQAREVARRYLDRYPKQGYDTHVAHWHVTADGQIHFTIGILSKGTASLSVKTGRRGIVKR